MLDSIRNNSQSFLVKAAFAVIILVFVFWGVGNLVDTNTVNLVGRVNGTPITYVEFERRYMQAEEDFMRRTPGMKRENLRQMGLGQHVFNRLVLERLLAEEAAKIGLTVTGLELRKMVGEIEAFQTNGKFDPALYKRMLEGQHTTPARFEGELSNSLLQEKLQRLVTAAAYVSPKEVRAFFDVQNEKREVEYLDFSAADFKKDSSVSDEDIRNFYESHKDTFAIPAKADFEYVLISPEELVKPESFSEAEVKTWYEKNTERFRHPEERHLRHILFMVPEDAPEADVKAAEAKIADMQKALAEGKSFADLAKEHSEDIASGREGGDLGWVTKGQMVPPFEAAAFAAQKGAVTASVRTQFGLHLILVEDIRDEGIRPLAEVAETIRREMASTEGAAKINDTLESLTEALLLGKSLPDAVKPFSLAVQQSGPKSAAELQSMGLSAKDAEAVMKIPAGTAGETPFEAGTNRYMLVRMIKTEPAGTETLEAVSARIADTLRQEAARKAALAKAADVRKTIPADGKLPQELQGQLKKASAPLTREGAFDGFMPDRDLTKAVFSAEKGTWLPAAYALVDDKGETHAVLVRSADIIASSDAEFEQWKDTLSQAMLKERRDSMFSLFIDTIVRNAKVEVLNADIITGKEPEGRQ